jgi:hypothetical protein
MADEKLRIFTWRKNGSWRTFGNGSALFPLAGAGNAAVT